MADNCDAGVEGIGQKRTRNSETFIDPSEVQLHCNDFSFDHLKHSLIRSGEGALEADGSTRPASMEPKRGFHSSPSDVSHPVGAVADKDGRGGRVKYDSGEACPPSPFVYYGSVPWVTAAAETIEVDSFEALHALYSESCQKLLQQALSRASSSASSPSAVLAVPSSAVSNPWEKHYELTTNNFFPIKNYIHRAFPTLLSEADNSPATATTTSIATTSAAAVGEESIKAAPSSTASLATSHSNESDGARRLIMEVGCGNGSAILSFLKHCPHDDYVCFDISATAVRLLRDHSITKGFMEGRGWWKDEPLCSDTISGGEGDGDEDGEGRPPLTTFVYDICDKINELDEMFLAAKAKGMKSRTSVSVGDNCSVQTPAAAGATPLPYRRGTVDQMLLVFVLCALPTVDDMLLALKRMAYWLKPGRYTDDEENANGEGSNGSDNVSRQWAGGRLLFRDYAILDHNMLRFLERPAKSQQQKQMSAASPNALMPPTSPFFLKGDGTSQFFFERQFTLDMFAACGLVPISTAYHCNEVRNRKNGKVMRKVFINAEFGVLEAGKQ